MIVGVFTGLLNPGGIERTNQHAVATIDSFASNCGLKCSFLSLNDSSGHHIFKIGNSDFSIQGFGRRKIRFVLAVIRASLKSRLVCLAHPSLAPLGLVLKVLRPDVHYIVSTYGIDVWKRCPFFHRIGLQRASMVTAPSQFTATQVIEKQKVQPEKVALLPPALDPGFFDPSALEKSLHPNLPTGPMLLTVSRLAASEQYKGIDTVLRALPEIKETFPSIQYVVVGDGDDRSRLEHLAKELGVNSNIHFKGNLRNVDLPGYYQACDVLVMPSEREGFGITFLEAMAFEKPTIGGNHGGTPDVIVDGKTGFLVEYGDVEMLTNRIKVLLSNQELCHQMGQAGKARVEEKFLFEHFQRTFFGILQRFLL